MLQALIRVQIQVPDLGQFSFPSNGMISTTSITFSGILTGGLAMSAARETEYLTSVESVTKLHHPTLNPEDQ